MRVPHQRVTGFCYAEPCTDFGSEMRPRNLVFITLLALCHLLLGGQALTNALPPAQPSLAAASASFANSSIQVEQGTQIPEDPGQEVLPIAQPEPAAAAGVPIRWEAQRQTRVGDVWTLIGDVVVYYRDYILHADKVIYHQSTSELEAEGHLQVAGGPNDILINASHGDMRLNMHTGRFYQRKRLAGSSFRRPTLLSIPRPIRFLFSGRVLLQNRRGQLPARRRLHDQLPPAPARLASHFPRHQSGRRQSLHVQRLLRISRRTRLLSSLPAPSGGRDRPRERVADPRAQQRSSIKGYIVGEQVYWVISRSMDMIVGTEYLQQARLGAQRRLPLQRPGPRPPDRALECAARPRRRRGWSPPAQPASRDATPHRRNWSTRAASICRRWAARISLPIPPGRHRRILSSYVYRLVFNDNYSQAISSEVASEISLTHEHNGFIPSVALDRFQTFAASYTNAIGDRRRQAGFSTCPTCATTCSTGRSAHRRSTGELGSSLSYLSRSEPRLPRPQRRPPRPLSASLPAACRRRLELVPEAAVRDTSYTISQIPDLTGCNGGTPTISHDPLNRSRFRSLRGHPPAGPRARFCASRLEPRAAPRHRAGDHLPLRRRHRRAGPATCCWSTPPTSPPTPTKSASR